jgi:hypothetical protein
MFGFGVESDVPLPELPRSAGPGALRVRARGNPPARHRWTWIEENRTPDGAVWLTIGRHGDDWILRFPRLADFELTDGGRTIVARAKPAVPPHTLRHLLVDVVVPVALSGRGHLLLHASGVAGAGGAALFVGATGTGKSTLAASFKWPLRPFSDDAVRIVQRAGRFVAAGAYPGARLWPDALAALARGSRTRPVAHYTEKRRVPFAAATASRVVTAIYVMQEPPAPRVTIRTCSRRAAVIELLSHAYSLDPADPETARSRFDLVTSLSAGVPVFTLAFPVALDRLGDVRDAVIQHLASVSGTGKKRHGR